MLLVRVHALLHPCELGCVHAVQIAGQEEATKERGVDVERGLLGTHVGR